MTREGARIPPRVTKGRPSNYVPPNASQRPARRMTLPIAGSASTRLKAR